MNIQYKRTLLQGIVALIMVVMRVQSVFPLSGYKVRKLLCSTIQIVFDQALFSNTNALFKDCRSIDLYYNKTVQVNYLVDLDKLWSNFELKRLKNDQDSPVFVVQIMFWLILYRRENLENLLLSLQ